MTQPTRGYPIIMTLENNVFAGDRHELSRLEKRLVERDSVIFDISNVEYIDAAFLAFLVKLRQHANKANRSSVKIVGANRRLRRIFEVTGLARLFQIEPEPV